MVAFKNQTLRFSGPYFPAFGLNTDPKKLDIFHAVKAILCRYRLFRKG